MKLDLHNKLEEMMNGRNKQKKRNTTEQRNEEFPIRKKSERY